MRFALRPFLFVLLLAFVLPARAQRFLPGVLPPDTVNTRHFADAYPVFHPGLSLNGFDCTRRTCAHGLGLRQVLEAVYLRRDPLVVPVWRALVGQAQEPVPAPDNYGAVRTGAVRLQSRALVALAAYVLGQHGHDLAALDPPLPPADTARVALLEALRADGRWVDGTYETDAVKWASVLDAVARALDLYLALETAVLQYEPAAADALLLSRAEKAALLRRYAAAIDALEHYGGEYGGVFGVDGYDIQAGNWPLKVQLAVGYALLTWQNAPAQKEAACTRTDCAFDAWLRRAFAAAGAPAGDDRHRYWRYQTDDGPFWAEGPYYFHLTLSQAIPFWHAARQTGLLDRPGVTGLGAGTDPFAAPWFTRSLAWLGDLATPDGHAPPLDDGNKIALYNTGLLRWTDDYGAPAVGRRFAWLAPVGQRAELYPVELAIPRRATPAESPLPAVAGNRSPDDRARQELVVRRAIAGRTHYLLLNGERGAAVARGEGHEQPDALQLLYYVDGVSHLVDTGYDRPETALPAWRPSTWNAYDRHNVLDNPTAVDVRGPRLSLWRLRVVSDHQDVDALWAETYGRVDVLYGDLRLYQDRGALFRSYRPYADLRRRVLFVRDPDRPYVLDLNAATLHNDGAARQGFRMHYHIGTDRAQQIDTSTVRFDSLYATETTLVPARADRGRAGLAVHVWALGDAPPPELARTAAREAYVATERGAGVPITRLTVPTGSAPPFVTVAALQAVRGAESSIRFEPQPGAPAGLTLFTSQPAPGTLDVLAVRAAWDGPFQRALFDVEGVTLALPEGRSFGFARLVQRAGRWMPAPDYAVHVGEAP